MFVLARDLHMTVAEMEDRMSNYEFSHWQALYKVENEERERATKET